MRSVIPAVLVNKHLGVCHWLASCLTCSLFLIVLLSEAFDVRGDGLDDMSARNPQMDTGNGDGPARKRSRMQQPKVLGQFPTTLEGFNYKFNEDGQLRHIETGKPYEFEVKKGNPAYNQQRYEALGKVITQHIYQLLETEANLEKIFIPLDATEDEPKSFVFASQNAMTTRDRLLILINGAGAVRAGQWARRLIINDCLDSGTQLPYIKRAMQEGYEVLVLNTNENRVIDSRGDSVLVRKCSTPFEHGVYAWDAFVANRPVKRVAIVAHSMGGSVTAHIAQKRELSFLSKVFAIAFTDSIHSLAFTNVSAGIRKFFSKYSVNWVSSSKPLDTPILLTKSSGQDSRRVSAGTKVHAETSWTSIKSVFTFLKDKESELTARYGDSQRNKPGASLACDDEDYSDDDGDTLEFVDRGDVDNDADSDKGEKGKGDRATTAKSAGIDISSSDEDTEASFDFTRYSEEL